MASDDVLCQFHHSFARDRIVFVYISWIKCLGAVWAWCDLCWCAGITVELGIVCIGIGMAPLGEAAGVEVGAAIVLGLKVVCVAGAMCEGCTGGMAEMAGAGVMARVQYLA